jgi:hypothetical protein
MVRYKTCALFPLLLSPTLCYDTDIATCNYLAMDTLQNNESSEDFGMMRNDSEVFGTIPNGSERKENHILTVHATARIFEDAGVPRTERSITNWCQPDKNGVSRLDCYFDTNERKYFITPQSVERAVEEEKSKIGTFHERAKVVDSLPGYTSGMAGCRYNLAPRAKLSRRLSFSTDGTIRPL